MAGIFPICMEWNEMEWVCSNAYSILAYLIIIMYIIHICLSCEALKALAICRFGEAI